MDADLYGSIVLKFYGSSKAPFGTLDLLTNSTHRSTLSGEVMQMFYDFLRFAIFGGVLVAASVGLYWDGWRARRREARAQMLMDRVRGVR